MRAIDGSRDPHATTETLKLKAPLSGVLVPIARVPDPVFSSKMVGDGIAIDPIDPSLLARCDGEVILHHPAHHALTLRTSAGVELLRSSRPATR